MDLLDAYQFIDDKISVLAEDLADTIDKAQRQFISAQLDNFVNVRNLLSELDRRRKGEQ